MAAQTSATLVDMENKSMKKSLEDLQLELKQKKCCLRRIHARCRRLLNASFGMISDAV